MQHTDLRPYQQFSLLVEGLHKVTGEWIPLHEDDVVHSNRDNIDRQRKEAKQAASAMNELFARSEKVRLTKDRSAILVYPSEFAMIRTRVLQKTTSPGAGAYCVP